jgi:hypothetical protein
MFLLSRILATLSFLSSLTLSSASSSSSSQSGEFSGLYTPNLKYSLEIYAGAWLQSKTLFLQNLKQIQEINALESTTTGGLARYQLSPSNTRFILMTRDYLDFSIEHLSPTTNILHDLNTDLMAYLIQIMKKKSLWLKKLAMNLPNTVSTKPLMNQTVVIIPFSTNSASFGGGGGSNRNSDGKISPSIQLRLYFFEATFWSIYRYFPFITICVSNDYDYQAIHTLQLPVFEIYYLKKDSTETADATKETKLHAWELPRFALLKAHEELSSNPRWSQFQYLYFTEGDQILHLRHQTDLLKFLTATQGRFALVPHRMQVTSVSISVSCDISHS